MLLPEVKVKVKVNLYYVNVAMQSTLMGASVGTFLAVIKIF